ncbi:hypothetical protein CK203_047892 [Vitis vinifera]|uniref:Reverse transcriptase zinc-binding domain-containing protein n=1 Tax=Vitis vinifera TaxID=29760 RepID=A0A438GRB3_VITVI|nr:hypothetical protein CK203_047892 [Vitis vinifera]
MESKSGVFLVKSFYQSLVQERSGPFPSSMVWNLWAPMEVCLFAWEATWERILTIEQLKRRGWTMLNHCFLCKNEEKKGKKHILDEITNIDAIEQEEVLSSDLSAQRVLRKGELDELILREEIHWRQKAKVKWVKDGDYNSKFFHKVANDRRNRNFIKFLENERGLVLDNFESISEEIFLYFKKLYSSPPGESWRVEGIDCSPILERVLLVLQDCWNVIKEDLVRLFAEFHNSGIINQSTNASFIVLLPKKSQTKKISDFRPISLITCLYKVIAKVLSRRLRGVLHKTIHSTQVNGNAKGWVKASRGLRQGDPLSSFLFIIVADVLSRMMLRVEERSMLEGFRVELQTLKSLLLVFGQISGLKVNLDKSNLFGINLDQNHLSRITLIHSYLSYIPSYFLSLFKIPASVAAKIERLQRDFLWSGVGEGTRDHLVSWDVV